MKRVRFGTKSFAPELIVFDKDGTLIDFKSTWLPVLKKRIEIVLEAIDNEHDRDAITGEIYRTFGVDGQEVDPYGPLVYTSLREDETIVATILYRYGTPWEEAKKIAHHSASGADRLTDRAAGAKLLDGVKETLESIRNSGIALALATADLSERAHEILQNTKINGLFDIVIGSDNVERDKPDEEMIVKAYSSLEVTPEKVAYVGDTVTDMEMGKRAGVGLVVGVTGGGVTPREELEKFTDVVIESLRDIAVEE
jgi:phosphoglycolate phosphatase